MNYGLPQNSYNILSININQWFVYLIVVFFVLFVLIIAKWIFKIIAKRNQYHDHSVYLVRLPKEKPQDQQVRETNRLQQLHEEIRKLAREAGRRVKEEGAENQLLNLISESDIFDLDENELSGLLNPKLYIGRAPDQVVEFIENEVEPLLEKESKCSDISVDLKV